MQAQSQRRASRVVRTPRQRRKRHPLDLDAERLRIGGNLGHGGNASVLTEPRETEIDRAGRAGSRGKEASKCPAGRRKSTSGVKLADRDLGGHRGH